jgi:hypothetical protein
VDHSSTSSHARTEVARFSCYLPNVFVNAVIRAKKTKSGMCVVRSVRRSAPASSCCASWVGAGRGALRPVFRLPSPNRASHFHGTQLSLRRSSTVFRAWQGRHNVWRLSRRFASTGRLIACVGTHGYLSGAAVSPPVCICRRLRPNSSSPSCKGGGGTGYLPGDRSPIPQPSVVTHHDLVVRRGLPDDVDALDAGLVRHE